VVGLADTGTRIQVAFAAVNNGASIFVPNVVPLVGGAGGYLVLVSPTAGSAPTITGASTVGTNLGNTSSTSLTVTGGAALAVYEVIYADPAAVETATISIGVAFVSNTGQNLPALTGTTPATIGVSFNPIYTPPAGTTADSTSAVPRFVLTGTPANSFAINACSCNLLFPFVTNQAGFDTGIAIANTSVDPFGTAPQHGPITLNFYGSGVNGAAAPAAITTADVAGGTVFAFTLSGGVSGSTTTTAGFQGYIISTANFQFCHGFAYVSQAGNPFGGGSEGYVALEMDTPFGSRTLNSGEVLGH